MSNVARLYQRGESLPAEWWQFEGDGELSVTFGGPTKVEGGQGKFSADALEPGTPFIKLESKGPPIVGGIFCWLVECEWRHRDGGKLLTFPW